MADTRQVGDTSADRVPNESSPDRSRPAAPISPGQRTALSLIAFFVPLFGIVAGVWLRRRTLRAGAGQAGTTDLRFANVLIILGAIVTAWALFLTVLALAHPLGPLPPNSPMIGAAL
jgi:hypothetical protein